jgi:predicted dehydrogenase
MMRESVDRRNTIGDRRRRPPLCRVGVIGTGNMGRHHARAYASLAGLCELHGVYDTDTARAADTALRHETRAYRSLDALLDHVDAVSIASPSRFHVEHALQALERGCDVLIEKPVALTVTEACQLRSAAARFPGRIVQVGHIEHFNPAIRVLRSLLASHRVVALDVQRLSPFDGRIDDADVVQDLMLHDVHVVLSVARSALCNVQTAGRTVSSRSHLDYAVTHLVFEDEMIASLSASRITEEKIRRLSATTAEAYVKTDYLNRTIEVCRWTRFEAGADGENMYRQESVVERIFVPQEEPLVAELASFLRSVRDRVQPEVDLETGIRCLEVVDLIRAAAHSDAVVETAA